MVETITVSYTQTTTADNKTVTQAVSVVVPIGLGSTDALIVHTIDLLKESVNKAN
jgi:hypothetical protein